MVSRKLLEIETLIRSLSWEEQQLLYDRLTDNLYKKAQDIVTARVCESPAINKNGIEPITNIQLPREKIADFCQRWKILEFSLFGSVLRDDFRPDSDIDVLVSFEPESHWTLLHLVRMKDELNVIFGRDVDLACKEAIEQSRNYLRRKAILSSAKVIYERT